MLMMRLSDLPRQCTSEPALHPWAAAYTSESCPMIGGRLDHYRSSLPPAGHELGAASFLADVGHEVPTALVASLVTGTPSARPPRRSG